MKKQELHYFTVGVSKDLFRSMKCYCAKQGMTIKSFCHEALVSHLTMKESKESESESIEVNENE
jgi:hypothetical protein